MTSTVAALLRNGVTAIAADHDHPTLAVAGRPAATCASAARDQSVPPVARSVSLTGISAANRIRIGHSIA